MSDNKELAVPEIDISVFDTASALPEDKKAKVREYAKLEKAKLELLRKSIKLDEMIDLVGDKWCKGYLWRNKNGEVLAVFDLEDDYLKNIVNWCKKNGNHIPKEIKKEYYSRFGYEDLETNEEDKFAPAKNKWSRRRMVVDPFDEDYEDDNNF